MAMALVCIIVIVQIYFFHVYIEYGLVQENVQENLCGLLQ